MKFIDTVHLIAAILIGAPVLLYLMYLWYVTHIITSWIGRF